MDNILKIDEELEKEIELGESLVEKHFQYFNTLDTASVITDLNFRILWHSKYAECLDEGLRKKRDFAYYISKPQLKILKNMLSGEITHLYFSFKDKYEGFAARHNECYVFRINRFDGAAIRRLCQLFETRYYKTGADGSTLPENTKPTSVSGNILNRIAGIFDGVYSEKLFYFDMQVVLKAFAGQATRALGNVKVEYIKDALPALASFNYLDLNIMLSAMIISTLGYSQNIKEFELTSRISGRDVYIELSCEKTGFAQVMINNYYDREKLNFLAQYGPQYLNLLLISAITDTYNWFFNISETKERTILSVKLPISLHPDAKLLLLSFDIEDGVIAEMLSPLKDRQIT